MKIFYFYHAYLVLDITYSTIRTLGSLAAAEIRNFGPLSRNRSIQTGAAACEADAEASQTATRPARIPVDFKDCHAIRIAYHHMRWRGFSHKKTPGRRHERKVLNPQTRLSIQKFYTISASVKQQDYQFDRLIESQYHEFYAR